MSEKTKTLKINVELLEKNRKLIASMRDKVNSIISDFYQNKYHVSTTSLVALMEIFFSVTIATERIDQLLEIAAANSEDQVTMTPEEVVLLTTLMRGALESSSYKFDNNISLVEN